MILANRCSVSELIPFSAIRASGRAARIARTRYGMGVFLRIDSREAIRANRPDLRCESPGWHVSVV